MSIATVKQSYVGRFAFAYLAYTLFGVVCLFFAHRVDHISPLFLPAGIALAAMLVWGVSMWPAVALGCGTVAMLARLLEYGAVSSNAWVFGLVCGLGGAAQAWLGVVLVRRFVSRPLTLEEPRDILWFLLLGGPVACLFNSALAAGAIEWLRLSPEAGPWGVFLTWWCGDTLGVLIAAPVMLTVMGEPAIAWRHRRRTVALPMVFTTIMMALALLQVRQWDVSRMSAVFERDAASSFSELRMRMQRYVDAVEAINGVYAASDDVTRDEFHRAVEPWMADMPGLQALAWAEPVARADRARYEAAQQREGAVGFRVFDVPGRREPAGDEWVVVRYAEPMAHNQTVLGLNGRSMPFVQPTIDRALTSSQTVMSAPFPFLAVRQPQYGVVMVRAIYKRRPPPLPATLADVSGFVYAAVRMDDAVANLLAGVPPYLAACLVDADPSLASARVNLIDRPECHSDAYERSALHQTRTLSLMGRSWQMRLWARDRVPVVAEGYHWLLGVAGVAFSASMGLLLLSMTGRTRRIEVAVKDRTARLEFEIAERHHTEQALRESEQRFRAIFDSVPIGVVYTDLGGTIRQANPGFCQLTGYPEPSLVGMSLDMLAHPDDRELDGGLREQLLRGETSVVTRRQRYLTRSGQTRQVQLSMRLLHNGAVHPLGLVGVVEDVTERARLQEAERAREAAEASNRAKSEFLSRMSHELRTPLNAMLGFAQLLDLDAQEQLSPGQKERVGQIQRAGWHLLEMINDVLDLSRIDAGTFRLDPRPLVVADLVDSACQLVEQQARRRNVRVTCSREGLAVPLVLADATRARQILTNLLSNAVKYNREGGSVAVRAQVNSSTELAIEVSDTGLGMTPAQLRELFQPFNRLGRERSATEGTGIGLVISRRLAELMGGSLTVRSEAGQGSTFVLTLPLAASAAIDAPEPESPYALAQAVYHRRRVIYIEDNEANASVMAGVFTQRPQIDFEICSNAAEGLAAIDRNLPDLILLDMHLPDFSGMDVLMRLKSDAQTAGVPVVMVSADVLADQIQEALALGAAQYLTKPIDVAEVLAVVDQLLEQIETVS
ncbi:CHASE domain-containing protein [Aquabacterium sp.]|uniref:CHASE domain-containing protein n=1 Tax=Aquabacterium sp. TaxID=1872578 RepID=UPI0035B18B1C